MKGGRKKGGGRCWGEREENKRESLLMRDAVYLKVGNDGRSLEWQEVAKAEINFIPHT